MPSSSRRKVLAGITGGAAAIALPPVLGQPAPSSSKTTLSPQEFALLSELTDRIIPRTETPGAVDAGVPGIIDAGLAGNPQRRERWKAALAWFAAQGPTLQVLTRISTETGAEGARHFELLKGETIDIYYSTLEGLKTELGWNANTFLSEFKGCTHPEHQS